MNASKRNVTLLIGPLFLLILAFQNCSEVDFAKVNGSLVEKSDFNSTDDVEAVPDLDVDMGPVVDSPRGIDDMPVNYMPERDIAKDKDCDKDCDKGDRGKRRRENEVPKDLSRDIATSNSKDSVKHLCGLAGPGRSNVIGFVGESESLNSQNPTSSAACMSIDACLEIASQAFEVIGPVRGGGICKEGKKNVTHLSDDQVRALVDKLELE